MRQLTRSRNGIVVLGAPIGNSVTSPWVWVLAFISWPMGMRVVGCWEITQFPTLPFSTDFETGHWIKMQCSTSPSSYYIWFNWQCDVNTEDTYLSVFWIWMLEGLSCACLCWRQCWHPRGGCLASWWWRRAGHLVSNRGRSHDLGPVSWCYLAMLCP